jgi:hypothetical protein
MYDEYRKNANQVCHYRRFFVTENGRIGLGPVGAEVGDEVCILFAGEAPFVLRNKTGSHRLIGECYVHGIMDGEAMDDESVAITRSTLV